MQGTCYVIGISFFTVLHESYSQLFVMQMYSKLPECARTIQPINRIIHSKIALRIVPEGD